MVILLTGASHTGKTALAQKLLEQRHIPYLSLDHLKMGLIRSGQTALTPEDDEALTDYLWPIVREMVKTAIENSQDLTVEGCYIPFTWREDFDETYLPHIRYCCLVMTEAYINAHMDDIHRYAGVAEARQDDDSFTREVVLRENARYGDMCLRHGLSPTWIDGSYRVTIDFLEGSDT